MSRRKPMRPRQPGGGGRPARPQRPGGSSRPIQPRQPRSDSRSIRPQRPDSSDNSTARLKQANRLMDQGNYMQATHLFEGLARSAVERQIPRAPFLFLQTGRAYLYGGQQDKGTVFIKRGLGLLANASRWGLLYQIGNRLRDELREKGYTAESEELEEWLAETLPEDSDEVAEVKSKLQEEHPLLPTNCPNCGAPVNSTEVIWMDDYTAECLYCGSAIRAES